MQIVCKPIYFLTTVAPYCCPPPYIHTHRKHHSHILTGHLLCMCVGGVHGGDVCWTALTVRPFQAFITEQTGFFPIATLVEVKGYVPHIHHQPQCCPCLLLHSSSHAGPTERPHTRLKHPWTWTWLTAGPVDVSYHFLALTALTFTIVLTWYFTASKKKYKWGHTKDSP